MPKDLFCFSLRLAIQAFRPTVLSGSSMTPHSSLPQLEPDGTSKSAVRLSLFVQRTSKQFAASYGEAGDDIRSIKWSRVALWVLFFCWIVLLLTTISIISTTLTVSGLDRVSTREWGSRLCLHCSWHFQFHLSCLQLLGLAGLFSGQSRIWKPLLHPS
jgi:hypothetical protein